MASFFRKRITQQVVSMLHKKQGVESVCLPSQISASIKTNRNKTLDPELTLPWKVIESAFNSSDASVNPKDLLRLLRNQGLPTAEGFIDIKLDESPLSLSFTADKHIFSKIVLLDICTNNNNLAKSSCLFEDVLKQNVVVYNSFPNIGEPCTMSHFRAAVYSQFVTNINKFAGHNVTNAALINDWGFNAAIFLTGYQKTMHEKMTEESPSHLLQVMKAAALQYRSNSSFKEETEVTYSKLREGDPCSVAYWKILRDVCLKYYISVYKKIGVKHDQILFDSLFYKESDKISSDLLEFHVLEKLKGSPSTEKPDKSAGIASMKNLDFIHSDISRHIAAMQQLKRESDFDCLYCLVPPLQREYYSLLPSVLEELDYSWAKNVHLVNLPAYDFDLKKSKNRNLEDVLDKIKDKMMEILHNDLQMEPNESLKEMSEHLGLTSLIVHSMKQKRRGNCKLDLKDIVSFERNSGASFQLCYAGLKGLHEDSTFEVKEDIDTSPLLEPQAQHLIQHLARFDEMVHKSYTSLEPYYLYQYLSSLWYFTDRASNVLKLDKKSTRRIVIQARLLLLSATLKILEQGLKLLGIAPLEKVYTEEGSFFSEKSSSSSSNKTDF